MGQYRKSAWVVVAIAAMVVLAFTLFRGASAEAVYPIEKVKVGLCRRVATRLCGMWRGAVVAAENARLRSELASLAMLRTDLDRLAAENARLRKALEYVRRSGGEWVAADVLSEGGAAAGVRHTLRLGRGSLDGLKVGAAVAVPEGLVGQVKSVSPHTAEVTSLLDGSFKVACEIEGCGVTGILSVTADGRFLLRHLMGDVSRVAVCSRVVTSGNGGVFPGGVPVGTVIEIGADPVSQVPEGAIEPLVDFNGLEDVFVRREK